MVDLPPDTLPLSELPPLDTRFETISQHDGWRMVREIGTQARTGMAEQGVRAYGQSIPLRSGMTLTADVQLAERSLWQWLLEPVYSLRGRL